MFFIRNKYFLFAFFAVCLIFLSHYFIIKREINIPVNPFVYVSDAETYVNMSNGFWEQSPAPFKYRLLLPFLVSNWHLLEQYLLNTSGFLIIVSQLLQ